MSSEESRIPDGIGRVHDEIVERYGRLRKAREEQLFDTLPEACLTGCTIARMVLREVREQGLQVGVVYEKLADCPGQPQVVGECSTQKVVCSHPEAGGSDNFHAQINSLSTYIRG